MYHKSLYREATKFSNQPERSKRLKSFDQRPIRIYCYSAQLQKKGQKTPAVGNQRKIPLLHVQQPEDDMGVRIERVIELANQVISAIKDPWLIKRIGSAVE